MYRRCEVWFCLYCCGGEAVQVSQDHHGDRRGDLCGDHWGLPWGCVGPGTVGARGASPQPCLPPLHRARVSVPTVRSFKPPAYEGPADAHQPEKVRSLLQGGHQAFPWEQGWNRGHFCSCLTLGSGGGCSRSWPGASRAEPCSLQPRWPVRVSPSPRSAGRPLLGQYLRGPASPSQERHGLKDTASPKGTPALRCR